MASQNTRTTLEALPTEILQMILSEMSCTDDLSAAIWASPRLLQSFLGRREQILIRVIESSLDPRVFMEVLGLLHIPNYQNLNYVLDPQDATFLDTFHEEGVEVHRDIAFLCRFFAIERLNDEFEEAHLKRLNEGFESGAPKPFPIPIIRQPVDQEQLVQFRRTVNCVVEIFGRLKRHMAQTHTLSIFPYRDVWVPGAPSCCEFSELPLLGSHREYMRTLSLSEQKNFLWRLFREKMRRSE